MENTKSKVNITLIFSIIMLLLSLFMIYIGYDYYKKMENISNETGNFQIESASFGGDYYTYSYQAYEEIVTALDSMFGNQNRTFWLLKRFASMISFGMIFFGGFIAIIEIKKIILSIIMLKSILKENKRQENEIEVNINETNCQ